MRSRSSISVRRISPAPGRRPAPNRARPRARAQPHRQPAARSARADRGRDNGYRPETRGRRSRSAAPRRRPHRPGARRRVRRRASPTSPGCAGPRADRAARRGRAQARDRHRASARGTRRTAPPPRPSSAGSSSTRRVNTPSVTTSIRVARRHLGVEAHAVADGRADRLAKTRRHAGSGCARREAPRLEHDDRLALDPRLRSKHERHARRFARARRRHQHGSVASRERRSQFRQRRVDGAAADRSASLLLIISRQAQQPLSVILSCPPPAADPPRTKLLQYVGGLPTRTRA